MHVKNIPNWTYIFLETFHTYFVYKFQIFMREEILYIHANIRHYTVFFWNNFSTFLSHLNWNMVECVEEIHQYLVNPSRKHMSTYFQHMMLLQQNTTFGAASQSTSHQITCWQASNEMSFISVCLKHRIWPSIRFISMAWSGSLRYYCFPHCCHTARSRCSYTVWFHPRMVHDSYQLKAHGRVVPQ